MSPKPGQLCKVASARIALFHKDPENVGVDSAAVGDVLLCIHADTYDSVLGSCIAVLFQEKVYVIQESQFENGAIIVCPP